MPLWRQIALAVGILLLAGAAYGVHLAASMAPIAAGYTAKQVCSCLFVSRRPPPSCQGDLTGIMALVTAWKAEDAAVAASVLGAFPARAEFEEGYGCHVSR